MHQSAKTLTPLTHEENNTDYLFTMQCSVGKPGAISEIRDQVKIWDVWAPGQVLELFDVFLKPIPDSLCGVLLHIGSGSLKSGNAVAMRVCNLSAAVFRWVVCVKVHQH